MSRDCPDVLLRIIRHKAREVAERAERTPLRVLAEQAERRPRRAGSPPCSGPASRLASPR